MEPGTYRKLTDGMTWSYSRIKSFDDCPYRWYLRYVEGCKEEPLFYSDYGSFMHRLLEQYHLGLMTADEAKTAFLLDFTSEVKGERPPGDIVQRYIQSGLLYWRGPCALPFDPTNVEKKIRFMIHGYPFVGILDLVGVSNDRLYILDHKSRNLSQRSSRKKPTLKDKELDDILKQLYLYAYGWHSVYGRYPNALCFNCFRENRIVTEPFRLSNCLEAISWASEKIDQIKGASEFRPKPDFFKCRYLCGLHNQCCYYNL